MKRDTVTLSQFIRKETRKLKQGIILLERERLRKVHLSNALPAFKEHRRRLAKKYPKEWPLREHPGDFSQSLDWFVFPEEHNYTLSKGDRCG